LCLQVNGTGELLPEGTVDLVMRHHLFPVGMRMFTQRMATKEGVTDAGYPTYMDYHGYQDALAAHFWAGTIAKQMVWANYEPTSGDYSASLLAMEHTLSWMNDNHWMLPAATLFADEALHPEHFATHLPCTQLSHQLNQRIARDLHTFHGKISLYEVWPAGLHLNDVGTGTCGESIPQLLSDVFNQAHSSDPHALLCPAASGLLTGTPTAANGFERLVHGLQHDKVPIRAICVKADFEGAVDATIVKHRLDMLAQVHLPIYITGLTIASGTADPSAELRKVLTILYSHKSVAGVTFGELRDREGSSHGFYTEQMQPKPELAALDELWQAEWNSSWTGMSLGADGWLTAVDAYHGYYDYTWRHEGRNCTGHLALQRGAQDWAKQGADGEAQQIHIVCDDSGRGHVSHAAHMSPTEALEASEAANEALMQLLAGMHPPSTPPPSETGLFSELLDELHRAYFSDDFTSQRVLLAAIWVPSAFCTICLCCALCCVVRRMRRTSTMLLRAEALRAEAEMENRQLIAQHGGVSSSSSSPSAAPSGRGTGSIGAGSSAHRLHRVVDNVVEKVDNVVDKIAIKADNVVEKIASKASSVTTAKDKKMPTEVTISTTSDVELREFT